MLNPKGLPVFDHVSAHGLSIRIPESPLNVLQIDDRRAMTSTTPSVLIVCLGAYRPASSKIARREDG